MTIAHHKIHKIPHETALLMAVLATGLAVGGILSWRDFQHAQAEKIQHAQVQLTDLCQTPVDSSDRASDVSRKVNESTGLLQSVPRITRLDYQTAQDQLAFFAPCIQNVRIRESFFMAQQLSQPALAVTNSTILVAPEWQTLKSNLDQSIALLAGIPASSDLYATAQHDLKIYRTKLEEINRRLMNEVDAIHDFAKAEELNRTVNNILANSPDEAALLEAEQRLAGAIQWLKVIPEGSTVSAQSQETLAVYREQLAALRYQNAMRQLKTFVNDFYNFTTSLDATLTYHQYSEQLSQFNNRFYTLSKKSPDILNHPVAQASQKALDQCNDAMNVWRYCHEGNCYTSWAANIPDLRGELLWLPAYFPLGDRSLDQAYPVPVQTNIWMQPYVQQNLALSTIWESARQNAATARDAMQRGE